MTLRNCLKFKRSLSTIGRQMFIDDNDDNSTMTTSSMTAHRQFGRRAHVALRRRRSRIRRFRVRRRSFDDRGGRGQRRWQSIRRRRRRRSTLPPTALTNGRRWIVADRRRRRRPRERSVATQTRRRWQFSSMRSFVLLAPQATEIERGYCRYCIYALYSDDWYDCG